jgi:hypothetical protein
MINAIVTAAFHRLVLGNSLAHASWKATLALVLVLFHLLLCSGFQH